MAMNPFISYLFTLSDECFSLAVALKETMVQERAALIALNTEEILLQVSQKESLTMKLVRKRAELKKFMKNQFQAESIEGISFSDPAHLEEWHQKNQAWEKKWNEVRECCESNQKFITHSMKNLGLLVDNLKRLFGQHGTYSNQGKRIDLNSQGKVVEARY